MLERPPRVVNRRQTQKTREKDENEKQTCCDEARAIAPAAPELPPLEAAAAAPPAPAPCLSDCCERERRTERRARRRAIGKGERERERRRKRECEEREREQREIARALAGGEK